MAKKKETTKVEESVVEETMVVEQPKVKVPEVKVKPKDTWEIKDRMYYLKDRGFGLGLLFLLILLYIILWQKNKKTQKWNQLHRL